MVNFHWILVISLVLLSTEKTLCLGPPPGQCKIASNGATRHLYCNCVKKDKLDSVSRENVFSTIDITNSSIGLLDSQYLPEKFATYGTEIILSGNAISAIGVHTFEKYQHMYFLHLANNDLVEIQSHLFSNLFSVSLLLIYNNRLKYLKSKAFYNLTYLDAIILSSNAIESIDKKAFSSLPRLHKLYLEDNNMDHFPSDAFDNVPSINYIDMSNNTIKKLNKIENVPSLKVLHLNYNKISSLNDNAFLNTPKLLTLYLRNNAITSFSPKRLALPSTMLQLDLRKNALSYLNFTEFKEVSPKIDLFNVSSNRWKCQLLPGMVQDAKQAYGSYVIWGRNDYSSMNYKGIPCVL